MTGIRVTRFILGIRTPEVCRKLIDHEDEIYVRIGVEYGGGRIVVERNSTGHIVFLMMFDSEFRIVASLNETTFLASETNPLSDLTIYPSQWGNSN